MADKRDPKKLSRGEFLRLLLTGTAGLGLGLVFGDVLKNPKENEYSPEDLVMNFGPYGTYKAVYDTEREAWTLGFWKENLVIPGPKTLADLKQEGGRIAFFMPFDGAINNSAGEISVDENQWQLGNPAVNQENDPRVSQGQLIDLRYGPENDSAGFQLWFNN